MALTESDPRPDQPTAPDDEPTAPERAPDQLRHGEVLCVSKPGKECVAILDRDNYRGPALTVPESDTILYLDEMDAGTRLRAVGERYPEYDHRETLDGGGWP